MQKNAQMLKTDENALLYFKFGICIICFSYTACIFISNVAAVADVWNWNPLLKYLHVI